MQGKDLCGEAVRHVIAGVTLLKRLDDMNVGEASCPLGSE